MGRWFLLLRFLSPAYLRLYWRLMKDRRVPFLSKTAVVAALAYALLPRDLLPDWIAFLGWMDDAVAVVLALTYLVRSSPPEVVAGHMREIGQGRG